MPVPTSATDTRAWPATWRRWASPVGNGLWAVLDQGLFAVANLVLNVALARWLPAVEYGAFAFSYSIFILLSTAHSALLTEPLLVFGSARYATSFVPYLRTVTRGHWVTVAISSLILAGIAAACSLAGHSVVGIALAGLALATPFILLSWMLRRACYALARPQWAAAAGALYMVLVLGSLWTLNGIGALSAFAALMVLGAASLVSSAWLWVRLVSSASAEREGESTSEIWSRHRSYGRWSLGSGALTWVLGSGFYVALPIWLDLRATAGLRALMNVAMPLLQTQTALAAISLPALAAVRGTPRFKRLLGRISLMFVVGGIAYALAIIPLRGALVRVLYGGRFDAFSGIVVPIAIAAPFSGLADVGASALRSLERPDLVFRSYVIASIVAVLAAIVLLPMRGVHGAAIAMLCGYGTLAAAEWYALARLETAA